MSFTIKKINEIRCFILAKKSQKLLPDSIKVFIRKQFYQIVSFILLGIGAFISLSILSYSPLDPSANAVGNTETANIFGSGGAYISDLLVQNFGYSSLFLGVTILLWGYRVYKYHHLPRFILKCALSVLVIFLFSLAQNFALQPQIGHLAQTGALAEVTFRLATPYVSGKVLTGFAIALTIIAGLVFIYCSSLSREDWLKLTLHVYRFLKIVRNILKGFARWSLRYTGRSLSSINLKKPRIDMETINIFKPSSDVVEEEKYTPPPAATRTPVFEQPKPVTKKMPNKKVAPTPKSSGDYQFPSSDLLTPADMTQKNQISESEKQRMAAQLKEVLQNFGVEGEVKSIRPGPVVTLYEFDPAPGTKSAKVISLAEDIARSMSALSVRVAVIPGHSALGIEIPNEKREMVYLREVVEGKAYNNSDDKLPLILGKDIGGSSMVVDLAKMPHLLIAGTTGSGKSVAVNTMILSLLYKLTPEECRLIMIDPKMLELSVYQDIPHLLTPVVTDPKKAVVALKWAVREMEDRYKLMSELGVRNIEGFNQKIEDLIKKGETVTRQVQTGYDPGAGGPIYEEVVMELKKAPYIVIIVDEMADLMMVAGKDIEGAIQRLAQMARAAGIHVVLATQRPSVDVITGTIKANFPTRISFQVTSKIDSRTILGEQGAEQLLGKGDMLYMAGGGRITRVHGPFVGDEEVEDIVNFLKAQGKPVFIEDVTKDEEEGGEFGEAGTGQEDELYGQAVDIIRTHRKASTSFIQRQLRIGYNRAATLVEQLEENGVIGPANHAGKRDILLPE